MGRFPRLDDDDRRLGDLVRFGTIASVDLGAGKCVVQLGEAVTGPIRWLESRAGATRTWSPPSEGEQVLLICPEGDVVGAVALRGLSSTANPPAGDTARELVQFADGTVIAYDPDAHQLDVLIQAGALHLSAPKGLTLTGPVKIEGDFSCTGQGQFDGDVIGQGISLKNHAHTLVKAGTDRSGPPA